MPDQSDLSIQATTPSGAVEPVRAAPREHRASDTLESTPTAAGATAPEPVATIDGNLRNAYAQFVVDPDTHAVIIRIRDAVTDEIIGELPSEEVQAVSRRMRELAEKLALQRTASQAAANL